MSSVSSPHPRRNERKDGCHCIGVKGFTAISPALPNLPDFLFSDFLVPRVTSFPPSASGLPICSHEQEKWSVLYNVLQPQEFIVFIISCFQDFLAQCDQVTLTDSINPPFRIPS